MLSGILKTSFDKFKLLYSGLDDKFLLCESVLDDTLLCDKDESVDSFFPK